MSAYGNFPVYRPDSNLFLFDPETRQYKRLELNSDSSDSWHCWSSNGRWILFSSKRIDGLFARPHISYFDTNNVAHKSFVLPQKNPHFYMSCIHTFNVPEFVREPIKIPQKQILDAIYGRLRVLKPEEKEKKPETAEPTEHYGSKPDRKGRE